MQPPEGEREKIKKSKKGIEQADLSFPVLNGWVDLQAFSAS